MSRFAISVIETKNVEISEALAITLNGLNDYSTSRAHTEALTNGSKNYERRMG